MPLPTALQARLQKRGLIKHSDVSSLKEQHQPVVVCPNACNPYHTCVEYCSKRWESTTHTNNPPLPHAKDDSVQGWFLVPDPEKGRHSYYWNANTNLVSWLHPLDPKADITLPANLQKNNKHGRGAAPHMNVSERDFKPVSAQEEKRFNPKIKTGKHPSLVKAQRHKERSNPYQKAQPKRDELDPMDPAAYSEVARGTWSSGLREDSDIKTGVDTTASGPLFQQRPYPSPGEVLRRNNQHAKS
eukprot:gene5896-6581_t